MSWRIRDAQRSDAAGLARVHVDAWRDAYAGIIEQSYLDNLSHAEREGRWEGALASVDPSEFLLVAEVTPSAEIIGFAEGGPQRSGDSDYSGELYALYVLPGQQRKGVGRVLVEAVTERLVQSGHDSMSVWVLEQNPARGFYVALGGRRLGTKDVQIGTQTLVEVAYGWSDIRRDQKSDSDSGFRTGGEPRINTDRT